MYKREFDEEPEFGILVHQFPREAISKAMKLIQNGVKRKTNVEFGLKVFFWRKEIADEYIRKKSIEIDGILYFIYPLVTCLTVYNTTNSPCMGIIKEHFVARNVKCLMDLRPIGGTSDYRVVLNMPEVLANFQLSNLFSSETNLCADFFCRLCLREGHKQYQCLRKHPTSSSDDDHTSDHLSKQNTSQNLYPRSSSSRNFEKQNDSPLHATRSYQGFPDNRAQDNMIRFGLDDNSYQFREKPSTSSTPTAAESARMTQNSMTTNNRSEQTRFSPFQKSTQRKTQSKPLDPKKRKDRYPCMETRRIIREICEISYSSNLCSFLKQVYHKKNVMPYVVRYRYDINDLIEKIEKIISHYNDHGRRNPDADKDIVVLERLRDRLKYPYSSCTLVI